MLTTLKQPTNQANIENRRPKRARQSRSKIKVMKTVFFDFRDVDEFLPPRQTVNREYYLSIMRRLREAIRLKRPELWANNFDFASR